MGMDPAGRGQPRQMRGALAGLQGRDELAQGGDCGKGTVLDGKVDLAEVHRHHQARTPDYDNLTGESLVAFAARVMAGLETMAARHAGEHVLAFTHGGVLDVAYRAATGRALHLPRDFGLPNAALNWLERDAAGWRLVSWADCRHLVQALDEVSG